MSNSAWVLIVASLVAFFFSLMVIGLSRHKRSASRKIEVMGAVGVIEIALEPEGAVIVNGELWRARFKAGPATKAETKVRVVGTQGHLLLVEPASQRL